MIVNKVNILLIAKLIHRRGYDIAKLGPICRILGNPKTNVTFSSLDNFIHSYFFE